MSDFVNLQNIFIIRSPEAFRRAAAKVESDAEQEDDVKGEDKTEEKHVCEEKRESF